MSTFWIDHNTNWKHEKEKEEIKKREREKEEERIAKYNASVSRIYPFWGIDWSIKNETPETKEYLTHRLKHGIY